MHYRDRVEMKCWTLESLHIFCVFFLHCRHFNGWRHTFYNKPGGLVYHVAGGKNTKDKYDSVVFPICMQFNSGNFTSIELEGSGWQRLL